MKRREFITLLGGAAAAWPLAARAQPASAAPRIGVLSVGTVTSSGHLVDAFEQGLKEFGYIEGRTIVIERRYAEGQLDRLQGLAGDLVASKVDILFAPTGSAALAARKATDKIPIVFALVTDPVGERFVASLGHPGGTMTGMTNIAVDLAAKRLEILSELGARTSRIGVLYFTAYPGVLLQLDELQRAAKLLNKSIFPVEAGRLDEMQAAFDAMVKWKADSSAVIENPFYFANREKITELATSSRLPAIYNSGEYVRSGGLISYGASYSDLYRQAAGHVDKILKGVKPADLPVEQPTKFELVINQKTAKSLDIDVPPTLLARADEVIE